MNRDYLSVLAARAVGHIEAELESVELLVNDGRHGIRDPWIVARGETRHEGLTIWRPRGIGRPPRRTIRRLYVHPSGYVVEGGRGGARVFGPVYRQIGEDPPYTAVSNVGTKMRMRSIKLAVEVVEALYREKARG